VLAALLPGPGEPADDVTLLLARTPAAPLASAQTTLQPKPQQVAAGRRFTRDTLTAWQHTELADTACLLVSEILTNAVHHARHTIGLHLHHTAREIIAEITDDNTQLPQPSPPAAAGEGGRGLTLLDALAGTWGARPSSTGKSVWFTLTIDAAPQ
jgi:anti-sigma regulatory factor (Ser/Thr protein kinase)